MTTINFAKYNAWRDAPDSRDYIAEELFGAIPQVELPSKVILDQTPVLNQWAIGACTVFGSSGALFETISQRLTGNGLKYAQPYDPWVVWAEAKKRGASDTLGWTIQGALQLIKDLGLSSAYVKLWDYTRADLYTLKYYLHSGKCIVTGSRRWNWWLVVETGIYSEASKDSGHCFQINWYDDNYVFPDGTKGWFHSPNSWAGRGAFWMKYSDAEKLLYSQYYEIGTEDIEELKKIAQIKESNDAVFAEKARVAGIWNGNAPDSKATNYEISVMFYRTQKAGQGTLSRQKVADIIQANILRGKADFKFWNKTSGARIATDDEIGIMFTRAVTRNNNAQPMTLTRKQVAVVLGRDF